MLSTTASLKWVLGKRTLIFASDYKDWRLYFKVDFNIYIIDTSSSEHLSATKNKNDTSLDIDLFSGQIQKLYPQYVETLNQALFSFFHKKLLQEFDKWEKYAASSRYRHFHSTKLLFMRKFWFWVYVTAYLVSKSMLASVSTKHSILILTIKVNISNNTELFIFYHFFQYLYSLLQHFIAFYLKYFLESPHCIFTSHLVLFGSLLCIIF